jgi:transcriptional regulator with XRE-family HTH domain
MRSCIAELPYHVKPLLPCIDFGWGLQRAMKSFPEKLKQLRQAKKMSQAEVGDLVGVTRSAVQQWEKAKTIPDLEKLFELARFFDISIPEFTGADPVDKSIDQELRELPDAVQMILRASFHETIKQFKPPQKN